MKRKLLIILLIACLPIKFMAQSDSIEYEKDYSFVLMDAPAKLFTMRQFNENYLSGYRLFTRGLNKHVENRLVREIGSFGVSFLLMVFTHEEGHRSILTGKNIGSVSQPYFNKHGAAYVVGVSDATLQNLRDTDLPNYIRLHTAGLESDYMLTNKVEELISFEQEKRSNVVYEYFFRKYALMQYYLTGLFNYDIDLKEEENELERDIVGHDVYGAARHLHRPDMDFYRYTKLNELTNEEKDFVKRAGIRSFLNLLNPNILGKANFRISDNFKVNFGLGYTMAPFGDFIDENIWLKVANKYNISFYLRQFQNMENWFLGTGLGLVNFDITKRIRTTVRGHFWEQPADLDFDTSNGETGGSADIMIKYFFFNNNSSKLKAYSLDIGFLYKTKGFLPEELHLDKHWGFRFGATVRL